MTRARRRDLPAIYDLVSACFPEAPRAIFVAQYERDSTMRLRHARIGREDGRVLAHVRIFARRMLVRGVPVAAGGIGAVATAADARDAGHATALLREAIDQMRRDSIAVSFLFTGIPGFYERLGWRVVREPELSADAREAAALAHDPAVRVRAATGADLGAMLRIYRRASAGGTGAIVRTARTWRDATAWLDEDASFVAQVRGAPVAYLRSRARHFGRQILEAEHLPGHAGAIAALVAAAGQRAAEDGAPLVTLAPEGHALALALQTLPSTRSTPHVRFPEMLRIIDLRTLLDALMPWLRARAAGHRGGKLVLGLRAPDEQRAAVVFEGASARIASVRAEIELDEAGTLRALFGQARASSLVRPRPPAGVARRLDALLPETPLRFWNSDRI